MQNQQPLLEKPLENGSTAFGMLYMLMGSTSMAFMNVMAKVLRNHT
jgi:hypothetical protein